MKFTGEHPAYIGDGLYASFDGYHVWLEAERDGQIHSIALEPDIIPKVREYYAQIVAMYSAKKETPHDAPK